MFPKTILPRIKKLKVRKSLSKEPIEEIYESLEDKSHTAFLKTGKSTGEHLWSIIGENPYLIFRSKGSSITIYGKEKETFEGNPFSCLQEIIDNYLNVPIPSNIPFPVSAIGAFSYDLKDLLEDIPSLCSDETGCPDIHFAFFRKFLIINEKTKEACKIDISTDIEKFSSDLIPGCSEPKSRRSTAASTCGNSSGKVELKSNFTREEYEKAVAQVIMYIKKGTIYQANISQQFKIPFSGDSFRVFELLNSTNPAPMSAYLDCGDFRLISSSPERFLLKKGKYVESKPIKGTRPRGKDGIEDFMLREELMKSEKDSAELAMIVDLVRNDLGRTAQPGTVRVAAPRVIEEYTNVFHSLAIITSRLKEDVNSMELMASCFPGGSITGCPKVQAMKVIEEIEKVKRSFYCGSIGYLCFNGDFDLNIAIRTFIEKNGKLYFGLGGGVVYDSDPGKEYEETLHKGETMFNILKVLTRSLPTYRNKSQILGAP